MSNTSRKMQVQNAMPRSFSAYFTQGEQQAVETLLKDLPWPPETAAAAGREAAHLIEKIRSRKSGATALESFLQNFALDTEEGLALMTLSEALLRIPDSETGNELIREKITAANWLKSIAGSQDWSAKIAGAGLFMASKGLGGAIGRVSEPVMRQAILSGLRMMGRHFVLGESVEAAFRNAMAYHKKGERLSYDMLGEGARTAQDARRYCESYARAIDYIGTHCDPHDPVRPGISVKLSALHPRYEYAQEERCLPEITQRLAALADLARKHNLVMTIDAEETRRLNSAVHIIERILSHPDLKDWTGFGLAVQAYHKAAPPLIDHIAEYARDHARPVHIRLVKGAYWDSEIKAAQIAGLEEFPVYTRKTHTDLSYIACAAKMLSHSGHVYPIFATHNAHTVACILELAAGSPPEHYEFQRLFGMGDNLFQVLREEKNLKTGIYAPVGLYHDLLPYLVRRLLENGANTSFVNRVLKPGAPVEELVADPVDKIRTAQTFRHTGISSPSDLFVEELPEKRCNSKGVDLHAPEVVAGIQSRITALKTGLYEAAPLIGGRVFKDGHPQTLRNPANKNDTVGTFYTATPQDTDKAFESARAAFPAWNGHKAQDRAAILEKIADLYEENREELMGLLVREAGKTLPDAHDELREAVDFCRYYAGQGVTLFRKEGTILPGPTGETNTLSLHGRGVFVCISPWNFPLAIFTGQIAAALMAGNAVIAKPAEQTPLIAMKAVQLMHRAGIPPGALHLLPGDGSVGAQAVSHSDTAGVAFTGSTETAQKINLTLATKSGPIVPFIAETGGQNAMIVDSSALPEQVVDDVLRSAFGSAGQRCSALRILCLQRECSDKIIAMLTGAVQELTLGDPFLISSDIGPVIDEEALDMLETYRESVKTFGTPLAQTPFDKSLTKQGHFFAPCLYEITDITHLGREIFGPVLHVIRYDKNALDTLLEQLKATGYGLTLGIHSRIKAFQDKIIAQMPAGNIYVNRAMTGAVVGSQPFGGTGLSGTGPKAGGPHYLQRFAHEKTLSVDTTAAGGNASLVSLQE